MFLFLLNEYILDLELNPEMPPDYKYEYEYEYDYSNNDITNPPESLETVQTQPTIPVASDVPLLPTEDKKIIPDHRRGLKKPKMKMDSKIRRIQMVNQVKLLITG